MDAFSKLVGRNYRIPDAKGLHGTIFVSFVVEADGSLSTMKIINDIGQGAGQELLRVLRLSELWIPGELNGRAIRCTFSLPVKIHEEK